MSLTVYLRSPRESMCGWVHLPRYIDKIRLHLAGLLPPEYEELLGDQSDRRWLEAAGVRHEQMTDVVRGTLTDGPVCEWVRLNVRRTDEEKVRAAGLFCVTRFPAISRGESVSSSASASTAWRRVTTSGRELSRTLCRSVFSVVKSFGRTEDQSCSTS
jgi:Domain of unknown function (DUF5069)